eukprot:GFUD01012648.1.p2 GENE.GFUD01012648.1~~GFUD01012648.1.p2  ORF type:complete len:240 (-),score=26.13 GFUD01012648.1:782-1462(-)
MEPRVIMLMGPVSVCQATPDLCARKNVHTVFSEKTVNRSASVKMKANVTWLMEAVPVIRGGRVLSVWRGFVSERNCTDHSARLLVPATRTIHKCATLGLVNAFVKMDFPAVTVTDLALYTLMVLAAVKCALVKMMPIVTRQMDLAFVLQGGLDLTVLCLVRRASMEEIASLIAIVRMGQSVIRHPANVIVLTAGVEYFVTLCVQPDNLVRTVKRNVIVPMLLRVTT